MRSTRRASGRHSLPGPARTTSRPSTTSAPGVTASTGRTSTKLDGGVSASTDCRQISRGRQPVLEYRPGVPPRPQLGPTPNYLLSVLSDEEPFLIAGNGY